MIDVEKLDQPCSCTLVEVVVKVSRPFTLVSERQSDNYPLPVCNRSYIPPLASSPHLLTSLADVAIIRICPRRICGHWQSLGNYTRPYTSTLGVTHRRSSMDLPLGTVHESRRSPPELTWTGTQWLVPYHSDLPLRFPTHAASTFKYLGRKALDTCVQRSAIVHIFAPQA